MNSTSAIHRTGVIITPAPSAGGQPGSPQGTLRPEKQNYAKKEAAGPREESRNSLEKERGRERRRRRRREQRTGAKQEEEHPRPSTLQRTEPHID